MAERGLSRRRACRAVGISRSATYRVPEPDPDRDEAVMAALNAVVALSPKWGFWKSYDKLRMDGKPWNHKRVYRVYCGMRLNLPRRTKKRVPKRERQTLEVAAEVNASWAIDFMSDALVTGRRFRTLNILDEGVREALDIVVDTSIPGGRVVRALDHISRWRGLPREIRCDNGPEFISQAMVDWCEKNGVELKYIQPGKPNQNAYIERFNKTYRDEVLNAHLFTTIQEVREITYRWLPVYNEMRPHDSLGRIPPAMFREQLDKLENSTFELST